MTKVRGDVVRQDVVERTGTLTGEETFSRPHLFSLAEIEKFPIDKHSLPWYTFLEDLNNGAIMTPSVEAETSTIHRPPSIVQPRYVCSREKKLRSNKHCFT
jgi:hypothetical protein